jgi:hypothetical protein
MRALPVIALLMLGSATVSAQEIAIAPQLRTGDEFRLEVNRTRKNSGRPQQDARGTTPVDVRVVSVTATGITLEWIPGDTTFDNSAVARDPLMGAAAAALKGLRLRINLSADGEFVGLANQAEVQPRLQAAVDIIMNDAIAKIPEDQRKGFRSFITQILSPATLLASVTSDAQTYFGLNGVTISVGEAIDVKIDQPNPVGGTIAARFRVRAESATKESAVLITTTTYDPAALREMTRALAAKSGQSIPREELDKLPSMEMADDGKFVFDRSVGLMREVIVNRRISMGDAQQRFDGWEIRLIKSPTR